MYPGTIEEALARCIDVANEPTIEIEALAEWSWRVKVGDKETTQRTVLEAVHVLIYRHESEARNNSDTASAGV